MGNSVGVSYSSLFTKYSTVVLLFNPTFVNGKLIERIRLRHRSEFLAIEFYPIVDPGQ